MSVKVSLAAAVALMGACASLPPVVPPVTPGPPVALHLGVVGAYHGPLDTATLKTLATSPDLTLRAAVTTAAQAQLIADSLIPYPTLKVAWLVEGADGPLLEALLPVLTAPAPNPTSGIELGNELDLAGLTPAQFGAWIRAGHSALRANGYTGRIISGGIYTTQPDALKYLTDAGVKDWPADLVVGLHRYGDPDDGVSGYRSRDDETNAILSVTAGHRVAFTEFGYPTRTPDDEAWAASAVLRDLDWFRKARAELATEYQYTDGPGAGNLDHFGIRAFDGRWKPVAVSIGIPLSTGPPPAPQTLAFDLVACRTPFVNNYCDGPAGATFALEVGPNVWKTFAGDGNGYVWASGIPNVPDSHLIITAPGYADLSVHISPPTLKATNDKGIHNAWELALAHVDPSTFSLQQLSNIRGAMWPQTLGACGNLSLGPRPGQDTNIFATVFLAEYQKAEQDCFLKELHVTRGYTHSVAGPLVDSDGYHGVWTPNDWRTKWESFLDMLQTLWDAKLAPVVFIKPDGWSLDQTKAQFTALLQQPRAQRLIRMAVPMGWEAGADYEYSSCTWAAAAQWIRETLPQALVLVHMPGDRDAPAGTDTLCNDDDKTWNPGGNAAAWGRVTPYIHGWLVQNGAFECPTCVAPNGKTNYQNFQDQFNPTATGSYYDRFHRGYAGWPTTSAWGDRPIYIYAGEYSAYWRFWQQRPESEGVTWGNAALAAGADGYLDSGSAPVTVH